MPGIGSSPPINFFYTWIRPEGYFGPKSHCLMISEGLNFLNFYQVLYFKNHATYTGIINLLYAATDFT